MALPAEQTEEQIPPASANGEPPGHDPYAAFRFPAYRVFALSFLLSVLGQHIVAATMAWVVWELTRSPGMLAWIGFVQAAPILLLALPAGHVADVFPRRRVMILTQLALVVGPALLALLVIVGKLNPLAVYLVLLSDAIASTFLRPARASMMPALVPLKDFSNAVTWNSTMFQTFAAIGPGMTGLLIGYASPAVALTLASICMGLALLTTFWLPDYRPIRQYVPLTTRSLIAGVRFVFQSKLMLASLTLDMFAVLFGGATILLPIFAERLGVGPVGYGWLLAAGPIGAIMMAMIIAHAPPMRHAGRSMLLAVAGFGAAMTVFGLSHNFVLSFLMLLLSGMFDNVSVVVRHTLVQVLTPDSMRGRVSAVNHVFIGSSNELGAVESGLTARWFGPVASVVSGGIATIIVVILIAMRFPQVRKLGSLRDVKPE